MSNQKILALLALSLVSVPFVLSANTSFYINSTKTVPNQNVAEANFHTFAHNAKQLDTTNTLKPMGTYVGELQEKWHFPSDHLPIGMTFESLNFMSWNVLDAQYMSWVTEKNSQGLSRSMIADEHVYIGNSKLTIRDKHVAELILQTIFHSSHPRNILSLQECSQPFLEELRSRLPVHFTIISNHGEAVLFDSRLLELVEAKEVSGIFSDAPYRTIQDILFRRLDNGQIMRLVNVHLPGDPTKPGGVEFAQYLANTFDSSLTTLAMGDMNFDELKMADAMAQAFVNHSPFVLFSPYCTDISPYVLKSKAIDHFLVYSSHQSPVVLSTPDQLMPGLASMVDLLQNPPSTNEIDIIADFAQKNCLNEGILQKTRDYLYVQLNDEYLTQIFYKMKETNPDVQKPNFHGDVGLHFSIIRHDEWKELPSPNISEIGNTYSFTPTRVDMIQTAHKKLWVLIVKPSDELATLREQYAIGDMPHGHEFHIVIAQQFL